MLAEAWAELKAERDEKLKIAAAAHYLSGATNRCRGNPADKSHLNNEQCYQALETFYRCDGCQAVIHTLIECSSTRVCGMIFQGRELRSLLAAPILSRS